VSRLVPSVPQTDPTHRQAAAWALVLAGGDGVRLRELTRVIAGAPIPKQYCRITGDRSLLELTVARTSRIFPPSRTLVIVNRDHLPVARPQLRSLPVENVVVQPANRDTGPGILLGLLDVARRAPDATLAIFPSDHFVRNETMWLHHVERATDTVAHLPEKIVLLGIPPDRVDPGLGYLEPRRPLPLGGGAPAFEVSAFHEKPTTSDARRLIAGGALWNSFVLVFRLPAILMLLQRSLPAAVAGLCGRNDPTGLERAYRNLTPWNFSRDFLARIPDSLVAIRADDVGWSDWGTVEAIERTLVALGRNPPWGARGTPRWRRRESHSSIATADQRLANVRP